MESDLGLKMIVDAATVSKKVDVLSKRVDYLEDQLSKIYLLLKGINKDLMFWRDDEKTHQG